MANGDSRDSPRKAVIAATGVGYWLSKASTDGQDVFLFVKYY